MGFAYAQNGDYEQAVGQYQQAIERHVDEQAKAMPWLFDQPEPEAADEAGEETKEEEETAEDA